MKSDNTFEQIILRHRAEFSDLFSFDLREIAILHLDLGPGNSDLRDRDMTDNKVFSDYVEGKLRESGRDLAAGGYNEERLLYSKSDHFGSGFDARNIHLGLDIWMPAGSPIFAFCNSIVHSFNINTNYRDYGPTIILEHNLEELKFYTLYGHLATDSLSDLSQGMEIRTGEIFASIGNSEENGTWPPHLHFQIITDMGNKMGDFPGVTSKKEREKYLSLCPDPNLIMGINLS